MEKILIVVEGGIVQRVLVNNKNTSIVVLDFDDQSNEPVLAQEKEIEIIKGKFSNAFDEKSDNPYERRAHKILKHINY